MKTRIESAVSGKERTVTESPSSSLLRGTLLRGIGSFYTALSVDGKEYTLRCRKKFRRQRISPLTGDEILFTPGEGEAHGWIEEILPRRSVCLRPPAANVSLLLIVLAPEPAPDLLLADRLIARAFAQGLRVALVLNKRDLDGRETPSWAERMQRDYLPAGIPVFPVSALRGTGLEALRERMRGETVCFAGQSGVGKSTLLNAFTGLNVATGDLSLRIARGRNTTRAAELFIRGDLRMMDSAGFSLLEAEQGISPDQLKERYPEFLPLEGQCRFRGCLHDREPGCAVQAAAEAGDISPDRLARYRTLLHEIQENWQHRYD